MRCPLIEGGKLSSGVGDTESCYDLFIDRKGASTMVHISKRVKIYTSKMLY